MLTFDEENGNQTITSIERSFRILDAACQTIIPLAHDASISIGRQITFACGTCNGFADWDEELILTNFFLGEQY
jgi:hypothetical protein